MGRFSRKAPQKLYGVLHMFGTEKFIATARQSRRGKTDRRRYAINLMKEKRRLKVFSKLFSKSVLLPVLSHICKVEISSLTSLSMPGTLSI